MPRLGRTPSAPEKLARRLQFAKYVDLAAVLPQIPETVHYEDVMESWGMMGNDTVGDCTVAAAGHAMQVGSAYGLKRPSGLKAAQILAAYSSITGYDSDDPNSDQGANLLDVLRYWQNVGIAGQKCGPYTALVPSAPDHWRAATYLYGGVYFGVWLPATVVNALNGGRVVDWVDTSAHFTQADGHAVFGVGYASTSGVDLVTWGEVIYMSYAFAAKYCDEAYAVTLPNSWGKGNVVGLDEAALEADLKILQGSGPLPTPTPAPTPPPAPGPAPDPKGCLTAALGLLTVLKYNSKKLHKAIALLHDLEGML